ncbi:DUF3524 domain-containing protein [Bermanella marisrubri]|uniref:tRNA-queuosine alpha-mannosyltransferase n=1 Tax=Bermanella marisrubri TaxID=207949 RepID=Q1N362_9GAMM|nr:DUF3524 domain-containing protein [Bermanella marisrubri]EAT12729.1 Glycosyltransferase [Oceanobacter sp. RED65] [Bermanella marisrubri]QIZ85152.1 DUF3524 domain-containing protein [Bermanella marisrubri]
MKVLLLSAYDTDSHKSWCQGLMQHLPEFEWHYSCLPGRYFSWRIRGNPLSWMTGKDQSLFQQRFDLIIATSMVDVATLRGLTPELAGTPWLVYFHENQFAYPKSQQQHGSIEPQMVNLYSALAADHVLFNSQFNRRTMLDGITQLMAKMPDLAPRNLAQRIESKSQILPVPINLKPAKAWVNHSNENKLKLIWNHRWEYDKGPDSLLNIVRAIEEKRLPIEVNIAGKRFQRAPDAFDKLSDLSCVKRIGTYESVEDYLQALLESDIVLSTASHEFQGLAMLEGAAMNCVPLAPNDLAYPEWIPQSCLYQTEQDAICLLEKWCQQGLPETPDVHHYTWQYMAPKYQSLLVSLSGRS